MEETEALPRSHLHTQPHALTHNTPHINTYTGSCQSSIFVQVVRRPNRLDRAMMSSMHMPDCTTTTAEDAMWPPTPLDGSMDSASSVFSDTSSQGKECKENGNEEEGEWETSRGIVWDA